MNEARSNERRWWWIGGAAALILVAGAIWFVFSGPPDDGGMSSGVPADLNLARARTTENGLFEVTIRPETEPVPFNRIHTWTLRVVATEGGAPVEGASIAVDGRMPEHGHGLPTEPEVTAELDGGDYRVEGVRFNMAGWWEFSFEISAGGQTDRVTFNLALQS